MDTDEFIYKIKKTKRNSFLKFTDYPYNNIILFMSYTSNRHEDEKNLLKILNEKYKCRKDIGNKYFEDNNCMIQSTILEYFSKKERI